MKHLLLVGIGGGLGAIARYKLGGYVLHHTTDWKFPAGTFAVNVIGCLVAGILAGLVEKREWFDADTRLFLFTGLLGGFTTFSAFGVDTITLIQRRDHGVALSYVMLSVVCGLAGLWLALKGVPR